MNDAFSITIASTKEEIAGCYSLMAELRPHLKEDAFVETVEHLMRQYHYRLAYLSDGGIKSVAGYRIAEWLHTGRYLEIEDLVTVTTERSQGYGSMLFDRLCEEARKKQCQQLRLVSGVQRKDAHRFYERQGMKFEAHYYSLNLG